MLDEIASLPPAKATARLQELYAEPVRPELIGRRIAEIKDAGVTCAVAVTPGRTLELADAVLEAEPDLLVIQAAIVSAEHVSRRVEPLNLKAFIRHYEIPVLVGGCTSYQAALHLMRTGAAGCSSGPGRARHRLRVLGVGVPLASAGRRPVGPHAAPRRDRHCHGRRRRHHDRRRHRGRPAAPRRHGRTRSRRGRGSGPGLALDDAPPTRRCPCELVSQQGSLEQILHGPAHDASGSVNLTGALRRAMALCGFETLKDCEPTSSSWGHEHARRRRAVPDAWSSTSARSTPRSSPAACARPTYTPRSCPTRSPRPRCASAGRRRSSSPAAPGRSTSRARPGSTPRSTSSASPSSASATAPSSWPSSWAARWPGAVPASTAAPSSPSPTAPACSPTSPCTRRSG